MLHGVCRLGLGLFKDTQNFPVKLREVDGEHDAARVQDEIEACGQELDVAAKSLAHAALDAVALVGLADDFTDSEADARRGWRGSAISGLLDGLRREEPAHGSGLALAGSSVGAHVVGVLAQARVHQSFTLGRLGR